MNFCNVCSISVKYVMGTLIGIALNLLIALGSMAILMMLILPIHEHGTCFHLFVSSLISFFSVVYFSEYRSFTSLVRFIPRYFLFLVAISSAIFLLISVSAVLLLVYRNAFDF